MILTLVRTRRTRDLALKNRRWGHRSSLGRNTNVSAESGDRNAEIAAHEPVQIAQIVHRQRLVEIPAYVETRGWLRIGGDGIGGGKSETTNVIGVMPITIGIRRMSRRRI